MNATSTIQLLTGDDLHTAVIEEQVLQAQRTVWIATADLKDMHVRSAGRARRFRPLLEEFDEMAGRGVEFRIVHSALPSRPFRKTLESFERLTAGAMELQICPRSHWKVVVVDGRFAYWGSANFTGAGLGARSASKRNLEIGSVSTDPATVAEVAALFDGFWVGDYCEGCRFREIPERCPDPIR